jgi:hypothetical protein
LSTGDILDIFLSNLYPWGMKSFPSILVLSVFFVGLVAGPFVSSAHAAEEPIPEDLAARAAALTAGIEFVGGAFFPVGMGFFDWLLPEVPRPEVPVEPPCKAPVQAP